MYNPLRDIRVMWIGAVIAAVVFGLYELVKWIGGWW